LHLWGSWKSSWSDRNMLFVLKSHPSITELNNQEHSPTKQWHSPSTLNTWILRVSSFKLQSTGSRMTSMNSWSLRGIFTPNVFSQMHY
jgi:hypothetical protein